MDGAEFESAEDQVAFLKGKLEEYEGVHVRMLAMEDKLLKQYTEAQIRINDKEQRIQTLAAQVERLKRGEHAAEEELRRRVVELEGRVKVKEEDARVAEERVRVVEVELERRRAEEKDVHVHELKGRIEVLEKENFRVRSERAEEFDAFLEEFDVQFKEIYSRINAKINAKEEEPKVLEEKKIDSAKAHVNEIKDFNEIKSAEVVEKEKEMEEPLFNDDEDDAKYAAITKPGDFSDEGVSRPAVGFNDEDNDKMPPTFIGKVKWLMGYGRKKIPKADLTQDTSFVYDENLKKWVDKNNKNAEEPKKLPPPPPLNPRKLSTGNLSLPPRTPLNPDAAPVVRQSFVAQPAPRKPSFKQEVQEKKEIVEQVELKSEAPPEILNESVKKSASEESSEKEQPSSKPQQGPPVSRPGIIPRLGPARRPQYALGGQNLGFGAGGPPSRRMPLLKPQPAIKPISQEDQAQENLS
jgi:hypothetical protein